MKSQSKFLLGLFLLMSTIVSGQLTFQPSGGSPNVVNTYPGGVKGMLYSFIPINDTLNNKATQYVGAMTIRPQDTSLNTPPIYITNGRFWYLVQGTNSNSGNVPDSITGPTGPTSLVCLWYGGSPICFPFGKYYDSSALNRDSSYTYHFNRSNFVDSTYNPAIVFLEGPGYSIVDTQVVRLGVPRRAIRLEIPTARLAVPLIGAVVSHLGNYDYNVSAGQYVIGTTTYNSPSTNKTLVSADPILDRKDVFYVDNTGSAGVLTGIPAADPVKPQINPATQIELTEVFVTHNTTEPIGTTHLGIYDEHIEPFTASATNTGGFTSNFDDVSQPAHLTKNANFGAWSTTQYIRFVATGNPVIVADQSLLRFSIKLKAALANSANIQVSFYNGSTPAAPSITLGAAQGFSKAITNYQVVAIPFSTVAFTNTKITTVIFSVLGAGNGFYLDYVELQGGIVNGGGTAGVTNIFVRNDSLFQTKNGIDVFVSKVNKKYKAQGNYLYAPNDSTFAGKGWGIQNVLDTGHILNKNGLIDVNGFRLIVDNANDLHFNTFDLGAGGVSANLNLIANDANITQIDNANNSKLSFPSSGNLQGNHYIPISVDGNFAGADGNIVTGGGGSGSGLQSQFDANNVLPRHDSIVSAGQDFTILNNPINGTQSFLVQNFWVNEMRTGEDSIYGFHDRGLIQLYPTSTTLQNAGDSSTAQMQILLNPADGRRRILFSVKKNLAGSPIAKLNIFDTAFVFGNYSSVSFGEDNLAKLNMILDRPDTLVTAPTMVYVPDANNHLHVYPIASLPGGGGGGGGTPTPLLANIYTKDSSLNGNRLIDMAGHDLIFAGSGSSKFAVYGVDSLNINNNILNQGDVLTIKPDDGLSDILLGGTGFIVLEAQGQIEFTTPSILFDPSTTVTLNGYTFPMADGSPNQVLQTNGAGVTSWATIGGGSGTVNTGVANRLAYYPSSSTTVDDLAAITANRALISDASGLPTQSTVTNTELGFVSGVTSAIQTQLGSKANITSPTFTGTVTAPVITDSLLTITQLGLGVTPNTGVLIQNTTAAALGAQQITPSLIFASNGWGTTASTSQSIKFQINSLPTQAATAQGLLQFQSSLNGAAYVTRATLSASGVLSLTGSWNTTLGNTTSVNSIATTSTDGLVVQNIQSALVGTPQQISPRIRFSGTGWDGSATKTAEFIQELVPVNGTNPITSYLRFSGQINAGGYVEALRLYNNGVLAPVGTITPRTGTATAGTSPLKFTSGVNLTTPEAGAEEYDGTERTSTNSTAVRGVYNIVRLLSSSASTLTLATTYTHYVFTGTTAVWTLPAVSGTTGHIFYIKNRGSAAITLGTAAAANELYTTIATNSITINAGEGYALISDGTYYNIQSKY